MSNRPKNSSGQEVLSMPIGPTPPDSKPVPLAALFNAIWENLAHLHNNGTQEPPAYLKEGGIWARPYDGGRQILQRIAGTGQEQYADVEIWWEKDGKVSFPIGNGRSLPLETVDLNNLKEAGLYRLRGGLLNAPEGISFGNIWVQKTDRSGVDTCCQLVMSDTSISMRNGALKAGIFKWTSWTTVISTPAFTAADRGKVLTVASGGPEWGMVEAIPPGLIAMWSGAVNAIPTGWALCDGTNGTPDLRGRFIIGAGPSYVAGRTGGAKTHAHTVTVAVGATTLTVAQMPSHTHTVSKRIDITDSTGGVERGAGYSSNPPVTSSATGGNGSHTHTATVSGSSGGDLPPWYALAYIMKL